MQAEKYKQIEERNNELKLNAEKIKDAHRAFQADKKQAKETIETADKVLEIANVLPIIEQKKNQLEKEIDLAYEELDILEEQKHKYDNSLENQRKFATMTYENQMLKEQLSSIKKAVEQVIKALDESSLLYQAKLKKP